MQLGVAYNFFNGEEHLIASLRSVRDAVDCIVIVYQTTSNAGEPLSDAARSVLDYSLSSKLADFAIEYTPDFGVTRQKNELRKRKMGLAFCRKAGCSHFLSMDTDEFYRLAELEYAKYTILQHRLTCTTVSSFFHLKRPIYRALDTTNVPFICSINWFTQLGGSRYPAPMVDPTRIVSTFPRRHLHFDHSNVAMYHMNFVRNGFGSKMRNSSTIDNDFLTLIASRIEDWEWPEPFDFPKKNFSICIW